MSHPSSALIGALAALMLAACVHAPKVVKAEEIRATADSFHQRIRWKDFRGAAEMIVPERRVQFEQALKARGDERDLSITDYELEQEHISADGESATIVSRLSWTRLPSVSEKSDLVTSEFVRRDGSWLLSRQQGGPFELELGSALPPRAGSR